MRRRLVAVALAATAASCASDGREPSAPAGAPGLDAGIAEALAVLPATDEAGDPVTVTYGDLAAAAEIAGLTPPPDPSDDEAVIDYVAAVTGAVRREGDPDDVASMLPRFADSVRYGETQETVDDIGFSILEVDRFVERSTGAETVTVLEGEVDGERMAEVLDGAGDGVWIAGDPDGDLHLDDTSPARPTGAPLWLHREDRRVIVTGSERDMAAARQADGGEGTLAADETLADLAHALDVYDAYSAMLVTGGGIGEGPEQLAACSGITGTAVGAAHDGRPLIVLAVASASADAAVANEEPIGGALRSSPGGLAGPWSDVLDLETIGTEGTVTTITMRPADVPAAVWRSLILDRSFLPC